MRRIVCCLDGTWNNDKPGSILTNVAKLRHAIADADENDVQQISHYVEGIASNDGETAQYLKGALGYGSLDRIRRGYEKFVESYEPGDELYLFGFSRGAFEARSLAGFISLFGIAHKGGEFSFDQAWELSRLPEAKREQASLAALRASAHYPVRIKCVGVWDTVGNLGNPFISSGPISRQFKFHDTRLSESVDVGLHALSIDEMRGPFRPTLWSMPKGGQLPKEQHIEQVWFAGSHADVGGGYKETQLSDVALLWMAERAHAMTGLAFNMDQLERTSRPDPLGPQHGVASGLIFMWSGLFPFVRLIKQRVEAISSFRRMLIGSWRSGRLRRSEVSVNESIHSSAEQRFGRPVIKLIDDRSEIITYRPRNLVPTMSESHVPMEGAKAAAVPGARRRVKIFTVHGTFDHEADWDNWDINDDKSQDRSKRLFINRLSQHLGDHDIDLDQVDHTQYNWSGGNSHDERRTAAIGLKKLIQETLENKDPDYYDGGVYVIGHSHGGTVARLAMNLWDKDHDYYDPIGDEGLDEFKHDDQCPICKRERNGEVGPNTARRPDGVITFGSPFVTFEKRSAGLLTAKIGVWVFRGLALVAFAIFAFFLNSAAEHQSVGGALATAGTVDAQKAALPWPSNLHAIWLLVWPLAYYWLLAFQVPQFIVGLIRNWREQGYLLLWATIASKVLRLGGFVALCLYYFAYLRGGWAGVVGWLPVLEGNGALMMLWWVATLIFYWLLAITLPSHVLAWLDERVMGLRDKLPKKYDPHEDRPMAYLSYHTPGDEAGVHLRIFGFITWLLQTLSLSAASALAFCLLVVPILSVAAIGFGFASIADPEFMNWWNKAWAGDATTLRPFVKVMDWLTFYPAAVWSALLSLIGEPAVQNLGQFDSKYQLIWWLPLAFLVCALFVFVGLMPIVAGGLAVAYFVGMWLRGSGLVFGGEKFTWTLANRISVSQRANANTKMRTLFITPEAWRLGEIAHCYYYKGEQVTKDVADHIANWSEHTPTRPWPLVSWIASVARGLVVLLFVLSIPLYAVVLGEQIRVGKAKGQVGGQVAEKVEKLRKPEKKKAMPCVMPGKSNESSVQAPGRGVTNEVVPKQVVPNSPSSQ